MEILIIVILIFLISSSIAALSFAPWVPAWKKDLPRIFKLADLQPGQTFYDLGCGDGRTVVYANKNFQAKAIGLEISIFYFLLSKFRQFFNKDKNLIIKFKNLFKQDLSDADVIYFYGMPRNIKDKLKQKLEKELKPGTKIISYAFDVPGWQPVKVDDLKERVKVYLYKR